jgi:hypothetical protein
VDLRDALRDFVRTGVAPRPAGAGEAEALLLAAREQGVAGLWHEAVAAASGPLEPWLDALQAVHRAWLARGLQQLALLARTRDLLQRAGLRSLALSGGAVAERLYSTVGERPMSDVDLLALDDWPEAVRRLRSAGYEEEDRADHAWSFRAPGGPWRVELHRHLTSCGRLFPFEPDGLWARRRSGDGLSAEDLLIQLALHASFQHGLVLSLVQWADFRRLLERETLDPARMLVLARRLRAERAVGAALHAAEQVVGAPLPRAVRESLVDPLPPALRAGDPRHLVAPSAPRLARVRWQVARGQRARLLRATLAEGPLRADGRPEGRPLTRAWSLGRSLLRPAGEASASPAVGCPSLAAAVLDDCLAGFDRLRLTVTGECMRPALEPGDTVVLEPVRMTPPRFGDVVLLRHPSGLRLHRLIWRPPFLAWRTKGDRSAFCDPALRPQDLVATVVGSDPRRVPTRSGWSALKSLAAALAVRARLRSAC